MTDTVHKRRPQYRNITVPQILRYYLPPAGISSILHRVSGALLFLCLPVVILPLFAASLASPESFAQLGQWGGNPLVKLLLLALVWAYMHHFCAGIRYLVLDLHIGNDKVTAQKSAWMVFVVSGLLTVVFGAKLFGVW